MQSVNSRNKLWLLLTVFSLFFSSMTFADNCKEMLARGYEALERGDYSQSYEVFHRLVSQKSPEAYFVLALFYKLGWGEIEKDADKACELFQLAAKHDVPYAQHEYGFCLMGHRPLNNHERPKVWFESAYKNGVYEAACDIGRLYLGSEWQDRDLNLAIEWCNKAAERSAVKAQITLGDIYASYPEVFDAEKAEFWYLQAINSNSGEAAFKLASLYLQVTGQDIENDHASNKALYLMEIASSLQVKKAYRPTALLYWKKLQHTDKNHSEILAKSYLWAKAAYQTEPGGDSEQLLKAIEKELPIQWKSKLDLQVEEFLKGNGAQRFLAENLSP
ncbi:hypothetical protein BA953_18620 [Vibrio coralliilyticus]|uniref:tetratricopeptide repeat protein n=1 Tax=Vibrio coralliilyticus TaxID=190893 RepID=UPI000810B8C9|nr:tetratricopeptide repeat protein [Vibrio coralliilyticus]ANW26189.1 hypothetical protein BA953_18620 [Vibrio coralliilyticus]